MTLRTKTLVVISLTFVSLGFALYVTLQATLLHDLNQLERQQVLANVERAIGGIARERASLEALSTDWAEGRELTLSSDGRVHGELADQLSRRTLLERRLSLLALLSPRGEVLLGQAVDLQTQQPRPLPEQLPHLIARGTPLWPQANQGETPGGILLLPEGPLLLAVAPLTDGETGTVRAALAMGRWLDTIELEQLSEVVRLRLSLYDLYDPELPEDIQTVKRWLKPRTPAAVLALGEGDIAGYALLRDIYGHHVLALRTSETRTIYHQGQEVVRYLVVALLVAVLLFGVLTMWILSTLVLSPLSRLNRAVEQVGESGDMSARVKVQGEIELAQLSSAINRMLVDLERAHHNQLESDEQYGAVVANVFEGILLADADTLQILDSNSALQQLLGYRAEELAELSFHDLVPESRERVEAVIADVLASGRQALGERQLRCADGSLVEVEASALRLPRRDRDVICAVCRDITQRKHGEEERRRLEAQVHHSERLDSLGVLAGGIAHDFNNLLVAILGNASLIGQQRDLPPAVRESSRQIETASQRAAELTNQMLAYSGKGQFVVEPVNVSELTGEMASLLETVISKKVTLDSELLSELPLVQADPSQLRQVVMNLVTNASDAIGGRPGRIHVRTGLVTKEDDERWHDYLPEEPPPGDYVLVEVADNGCGMDEATRLRIFDPFFTTKFTGRGLGLAATLGIVRGHHGAVQVDSAAGRGTTFRVVLPSLGVVEMPARAPEPELNMLESWRTDRTVLIVDDEETVRVVAAQVLEYCGFHVLTAIDGTDGVDMFREHAPEIDVVLLDMTMPGMNGDEVFEILQRVRPEVPVVLSSGYSEKHATRSFSGNGLAGFIQKPYQAPQLVAKLREVLEP